MSSGGFPTIETIVSFSNDGSGNPIETDVSRFTRRFSVSRGRQTQLSEVEAGTIELELNNDDRRFDSSFAGVVVNLIKNPGLDYNSVGTTGWATSLSTISRDNTVAHTGAASLKVTTTNATNSGAEFSNCDVTAGVTYVASCYGKKATAGTVTFFFRIQWYNASNVLISTTTGTSKNFTNSFSATPRSQVGTAPALATYAKVAILTTAAQGVFDINFDDFQFEAGSAPTAYCDGDQDNCRWGGTPGNSVSYRGGPYYGNVRPMNRIFQKVVWNSSTYWIGNFWAERWTNNWRLKANEANATLSGSDAFKILNLRLTAGDTVRPEERTDERVVYLTGLINFLSGNVDITRCATVMPEKDVSHRSVLSILKECQITEDGRMFIGNSGHFIFRQRDQDWTKNESKTSQATFGDNPGELPYYDLEFELSDDELFNDIAVTRENGTEQRVTDSASILLNEQRTKAIATFSDDDNDSLAMATYKLSVLKDAHLRIKSMKIRPGRDDSLWPPVLTADLGDRITINRRPPPSGSAVITGDYWIEGIQHDVNASQRFWETTWQLSPASTRTFWILGDATLSVLNSTTTPAY